MFSFPVEAAHVIDMIMEGSLREHVSKGSARSKFDLSENMQGFVLRNSMVIKLHNAYNFQNTANMGHILGVIFTPSKFYISL
jgi:hypothetical protein